MNLSCFSGCQVFQRLKSRQEGLWPIVRRRGLSWSSYLGAFFPTLAQTKGFASVEKEPLNFLT
jgi:hypothetical protein